MRYRDQVYAATRYAKAVVTEEAIRKLLKPLKKPVVEYYVQNNSVHVRILAAASGMRYMYHYLLPKEFGQLTPRFALPYKYSTTKGRVDFNKVRGRVYAQTWTHGSVKQSIANEAQKLEFDALMIKYESWLADRIALTFDGHVRNMREKYIDKVMMAALQLQKIGFGWLLIPPSESELEPSSNQGK